MRLKEILAETTTTRLTTRGGFPFTVYRNPSKTIFDNIVKKHKTLRGLITHDEQTLYLWDSMSAVHTYVIKALGLEDVDHIYFWGEVLGEVKSWIVEDTVIKPQSSALRHISRKPRLTIQKQTKYTPNLFVEISRHGRLLLAP